MSKLKRIYIASPYTLGDVAVNVKRQIDSAEELINRGYVPIVPLYFHFQHIVYPHNYETWIKLCISLLETADGLLRLSGESRGADKEELHAINSGIPIFYSLDEMERYYEIYADYGDLIKC